MLSYSKKNKSSVKVAEQYPPEMKERSTAQIDALKNYREIHKDSNISVKLVKDKLLVGNQVIDNIFNKNKGEVIGLLPTTQSNLRAALGVEIFKLGIIARICKPLPSCFQICVAR